MLNTPPVSTPWLRAYEHFRYVLILLLSIVPFSVHAEYIERFLSDIDVQSDGSFTVTETIDYRFDGDKHGIFREIPLTHPEKPSAFWKERIIDVTLDGVTMDGKDVPYTLESSRDVFKVRVGDPNATVSGLHEYALMYTVHGGLSHPKGQGTELYWNVTGNAWPVPIRVVEATLRSGDGIFRSIRSCYDGPVGAIMGSCAVKVNEDGAVAFRTTDLQAYDGMTIAQDLDAARVTKDIRERVNYLWFAIPLALFGLIYGGYRLYRWITAYKTGNSIIPQYEPYPGMKPMYTGLLMDGRLDARDITACIVYLAQQGYIKIRKTEKKVLFLFEVDDYEIEIVKLPGAEILRFEHAVLAVLFDSLSVGSVISLNELKNDAEAQMENHKALEDIRRSVKDDLEAAGLYEANKQQLKWFLLAFFISLAAIVLALTVESLKQLLPILFQLIFFVFIGLIITNRRRTRQGYLIQDYLEGFKLFLETTERDRYVFHNAPEKSPEQFMEYLPYAIAFGVEEKWAEVFKDIAIPNPDWYDGGSVGTFSATNLTTSLGAFSTAFAASSGTSASSGGGSSGGGVGGGGGGSW